MVIAFLTLLVSGAVSIACVVSGTAIVNHSSASEATTIQVFGGKVETGTVGVALVVLGVVLFGYVAGAVWKNL